MVLWRGGGKNTVFEKKSCSFAFFFFFTNRPARADCPPGDWINHNGFKCSFAPSELYITLNGKDWICPAWPSAVMEIVFPNGGQRDSEACLMNETSLSACVVRVGLHVHEILLRALHGMSVLPCDGDMPCKCLHGGAPISIMCASEVAFRWLPQVVVRH